MLVRVTLPLSVLRGALKARVRALRQQKLDAGITFETHTYDTTEQSARNIVERLTAITAGIPVPEGFVWRTTDNVDVAHTAESFQAFAAAVLAYREACYLHSFILKTAIDAAEEPASVDINNGWPNG